MPLPPSSGIPLDSLAHSLTHSLTHSQICYTGMHFFCLLLVLFLYCPIFVYLPYYFYESIADCLVYSLPVDHEKRMQAWEITQMLRIDTEFSDRQMWLFASQSRYIYIYIYIHLCFLCLSLSLSLTLIPSSSFVHI